MRVLLKAIGCRLNEAELETWAEQFRRDGHHVCDEGDDADVVVFNTCAVTREAARKSRQNVGRLHRKNPRAKMIVSGCYATLSPQQLEEEMGVDLIVDNQNKHRLVEIAKSTFDMPTMPAFATAPDSSALFQRNRQRAFIKIQDGCRYRCTFCIVTVARGEERSRTVEEILQEINQLVESGIRECVLTGVHVGGYGSDLGVSLDELVRRILDETDLPRLRFASVEPWDLPERFWQLFENPRLMPHMHLPLQSGADTVLRRMARRCKTTQFEALVNDARTHIPNFNVTTDLIVGFPGETEEEWQQTMAFVESVGFGHMHIFTYSPREGTRAASLPNPVPSPVQQQRSREMHLLAANLKQAFLQTQLGQEQTVLWEGSFKTEDDQLCVAGYTPNYLRVLQPTATPEVFKNQLQDVTLARLTPNGNAFLC